MIRLLGSEPWTIEQFILLICELGRTSIGSVTLDEQSSFRIIIQYTELIDSLQFGISGIPRIFL